MTSAHTAGPWKLSPSGMVTNEGQRAVMGEFNRIALIDLQRDDVKKSERWRVEDAEREANARLIAAAPELLACLKEAIELIQEDIDNRDGRDNFGMCCGNCEGAIPIEHSFGCRARAAISKAEGGK